MDTVRQWAMSLCMAAVAGAAAQIILPEGSLQKVFKVAFSVFFLCCLFSPVLAEVELENILSGEISSTETASLSEELESRMNSQIIEDFSASLEDMAEKALLNIGILGAKAKADINITEDGGILINRLLVTVPQDVAGRAGEIESAIWDALSIVPEVETAGE